MWKNIVTPSIPSSVPSIHLPILSSLWVLKEGIHKSFSSISIPHSYRHIHPAIHTHQPLTVDLSPAIVWLLSCDTVKYYK